MPRSPSGASARPSPRVLIKSRERNALHTSRIRDMVRLNGNRSSSGSRTSFLWRNALSIPVMQRLRSTKFQSVCFQLKLANVALCLIWPNACQAIWYYFAMRLHHAPANSLRARSCLLYTSDAADDLLCVDLGGRRIIKKKKKRFLKERTRKHLPNG